MMHFRGCSGVPNRNSHSGETEYARLFLQWLRDIYDAAPTAAVGISLESNYLAQQGAVSLLQAAVVVGTLKNYKYGWNTVFHPGYPPIWKPRRDYSLERT